MELRDPIPRLWLAGAICVIALTGSAVHKVGAISVAAALLFSHAPGRSAVALASKALVPTWVFLLLLHGLTYGGDHQVFLGGLPVSIDGLLFACSIGLMLSSLIAAQLLVFTAAPPYELVTAMTERGLPVTIGDVILNTLSLLTVLKRRMARAIDAQKARGVPTSGGPIRRLQSLIPLLGPVALSYLSESVERSLLMDLKGLETNRPRTALVTLPVAPVARRLARAVFVLSLMLAVTRLVGWSHP